MKIIRFGKKGYEKVGILKNTSKESYVIDLEQIDSTIPQDLRIFFEEDYLTKVSQWKDDFYEVQTPLSQHRLGAPIAEPSKIIAIGLNYRDHAEEQNFPIPERPLLFSKATSSINGPYDEIIIPPFCKQADYEVELAVVIGKHAKQVPQQKAFEYIAGYMLLNDVSGRDAQFSDKQWFRGKSYDTFCPIGPFIATVDEIPNPNNLKMWTRINGEIRQESNTANLIFKIDEIIEFISQGITLRPGDIIATGTPAGVGVFQDPPTFLRSGDIVEIGIDKLGSQRLLVR